MKHSVGLTLGKFLPFHSGHELMIQTALACVDTLHIIIGVSPNDPFSFLQRREWITKSVDRFIRRNQTVWFIEQAELDQNAPKDAKGTITDEEYWKAWIVDTQRQLGRREVTHVFTSDQYGERIAKEFKAEWFPVDPDRQVVKVSGTKVRNNLNENFALLPPQVQRTLVKRVALVGPESCGKSILVPKLAETFGCLHVPEWGRTICEPRRSELSLTAFRAIRDGQNAFIENAIDRSHEVPLVISDTEALVTALYYELYYPNSPHHTEFFDYAEKQHIDLYCVMSPHVPWVQDGSRTMREDQRWWFYHRMIDWLHKHKKNYIHTWALRDYDQRERCVEAQIKHLMKDTIK